MHALFHSGRKTRCFPWHPSFIQSHSSALLLHSLQVCVCVYVLQTVLQIYAFAIYIYLRNLLFVNCLENIYNKFLIVYVCTN